MKQRLREIFIATWHLWLVVFLAGAVAAWPQGAGVPSGGGTTTLPLTVAGTVTSGGIPYFNSTTSESSSAALAANAVVYGGGAGTTPFSDAVCQVTAGSFFFCTNIRVQLLANYTTGHSYISFTAPTITGAGCGGSGATISSNNGTAAFDVNVGATPGSACTITMPSLGNNEWTCQANDATTISASVFVQKQTTYGAATVVITNFNTSAAATAFVASDILHVQCLGG